MIETVAVGTDGSASAKHAVTTAFDLAQRFGARVVVISAYAAPSVGAGALRLSSVAAAHGEWASNEAEHVERVLARVRDAAAERGLECRTAMEEGDPAEVIVGLAERHNADLLVVGNRGMERRVLGSVPNTVSHRASCSVFVVKTT